MALNIIQQEIVHFMKIGVKWKYRILLDIYENMFLWKHLRANYLTISQEYIDLVHESVAEVVKLSISRYNNFYIYKPTSIK